VSKLIPYVVLSDVFILNSSALALIVVALTLKFSKELPAVITTESSEVSYIPLSPSPKTIPEDKLPTSVPVLIVPNEPVEVAEPLITPVLTI
jgi:hypothetical protein